MHCILCDSITAVTRNGARSRPTPAAFSADKQTTVKALSFTR